MPQLSCRRLMLAALGWLMLTGPVLAAPIDYNRQIRPILADNCFACHGFDENTRKAGLRLDTREGLLSEGTDGRIVVPGKSRESELVARILSTDASKHMPPLKSGKKLTTEQVQLLQRWIDEGANWSAHWAFQSPKRPALPEIPNATRLAPVDRFILARLQAEKLTPFPEATNETLIRRVTLDLTGVPPTPEEIDAFLADTAPNAYERLVDRLLASPQFGERMAMLWLDGARYADSNGYQADFERYQWRWRDWVIRAFNENKPFDQFTIEQMAGDLLPNATIEQKIATGFHRNHRINTEGGIIAEEWRIETVVDRVETTSAVWLGLTMGCARCHDHKYDPVSQREFYQMFSFFNNVAESGIGAERPINHPPLVRAPSAQDEARLRELDAAIAAAREKLQSQENQLPAIIAAWEKTNAPNKGTTWQTIVPETATTASAAKIETQADRSLLVTGEVAAKETYTLTLPLPAKHVVRGVRLEVLPDATNNQLLARSVNGNFVLTDFDLSFAGKPVPLASAKADFSQDTFAITNLVAGKGKAGWAIHPKTSEAHTATFAFAQPLTVGESGKLTIVFQFQSQYAGHQFRHFRLAVTDSQSPHEPGGTPAAIASILSIPSDKRTPAQVKQLTDFVRQLPGNQVGEAQRALDAATKAKADYEAAIPTVMVLEELPKPRDAFLLVRGQYDKRGDKVVAGLPAALPAMPADAPMNRLGLAKWMVDRQNPLTARVAVNRWWEMLFGIGIVKSSDNFGLQGEPPSHPELLDWLAVEFMESGWNVKSILKTMVMSGAYRRFSTVTPELLERDPENRLLARGPRFRLQAEAVRDNALAIAGLLVNKVGGPSVRPYQPKGVWDETNFYGNLRNYQHDKNDGLYRRSMYTIWKRTAAPPTMLLFDSATREVCTVRRSRTNTPLQALALLNEVTFVEASRVLAERMMSAGTTPAERITYGFRCATARKPNEAELQLLVAGYERRLAAFRKNPEAAKQFLSVGEKPMKSGVDPVELAAYTTSASVLLNLDETITKE